MAGHVLLDPQLLVPPLQLHQGRGARHLGGVSVGAGPPLVLDAILDSHLAPGEPATMQHLASAPLTEARAKV